MTVDPSDVEHRIRQAYWQLEGQRSGPGAAGTHGRWLMLDKLRAALPDISRADFDAALIRLNRGDAWIVPESNQKVLTPAERDAAVSIGNQHKHTISLQIPPGGRPTPAPAAGSGTGPAGGGGRHTAQTAALARAAAGIADMDPDTAVTLLTQMAGLAHAVTGLADAAGAWTGRLEELGVDPQVTRMLHNAVVHLAEAGEWFAKAGPQLREVYAAQFDPSGRPVARLGFWDTSHRTD